MARFSTHKITVPDGVRNGGAYKNLMSQVNKVGNHLNQGSIKTRERYHEAVDRFSRHLADRYNLQKFGNVQDKHLCSYIEEMKSKGLSASTIKTDLSAIRMYHDATPFAKHQLSENKAFDLERRSFGGVDRTWSQNEYKGMLQQAKELGRHDIANILQLGREAGLRIHECTRLDRATAERALQTGLLHVKGKGGLERDVPLREEAKNALRDAMERVARGQKLFVRHEQGQKTHQQIKSVQDFICNHRSKFTDGSREANMTFHGLRHSYAREEYEKRVAKGASELNARKEVSQLLGHERDDVTRIYINQ